MKNLMLVILTLAGASAFAQNSTQGDITSGGVEAPILTSAKKIQAVVSEVSTADDIDAYSRIKNIKSVGSDLLHDENNSPYTVYNYIVEFTNSEGSCEAQLYKVTEDLIGFNASIDTRALVSCEEEATGKLVE